MPTSEAQLAQRGTVWARGGAASALLGTWTMFAAGGGGQGYSYGPGTDADYGDWTATSEGEASVRGSGGGGAGYRGGQSSPYRYTCVSHSHSVPS